ncbi:chorismate--pyruvate lyase family protein [Alteromonas oceanisediminis]|uniref:chorismate--pyruvate lyase family protein n=1 Tax=Alteromonas oceanisediminis TaxID=2836180 RepID=UPI001BD958BF|nr:chorismate lyase [Alteromonas oceanisediminis]MBT0586765.1 chorismate lyase [Alteromonas oceanisediminis]
MGSWHPPHTFTLEDATLANWLLDTGSLTERLQSQCRQLDVKVLFHAEATPSGTESGLLNRHDSPFFIREVMLLGDGVPWVFARSVIPRAINQGELINLGNQPLGKRIFNDPRFKRGDFALCATPYTALKARLAIHLSDTSHSDNDNLCQVYGRRSVFSFSAHKLSVAEWFLPSAPAYQFSEVSVSER